MNSNDRKNYSVNLHRLYLKEKREALGRTVMDVGDLIGISSDYYCQIENGFRGKRLSVKMLLQIADALEMNLCEAIQGEKDALLWKSDTQSPPLDGKIVWRKRRK